MIKLARLEDLRRRLADALADRPGLAAAFERALVDHDEHALGEAFAALHKAPPATRAGVQALILDWLFGDDGRIERAQLAPEGDPTLH